MAITYARLSVKNPSESDDRSSAKFIIHSGCDVKKCATSEGGASECQLNSTGVSAYKEVTSNWEAFTMLSEDFASQSAFEATNPPMPDTP